jgi:hypothetical protein
MVDGFGWCSGLPINKILGVAAVYRCNNLVLGGAAVYRRDKALVFESGFPVCWKTPASYQGIALAMP